jgi:hypothetical protein
MGGVMRTTITIDDSLMVKLKEEAFKSGLPLKRVINQRLELGLRAENGSTPKRRVVIKTYAMGNPSSLNLDKALEIAATLEDDEILRKMEMRK